MGEWADQVGLRAATEMGKCARAVAFDGSKPEDLWVWQGRRRAALKQAMGVDLPTAYAAPKARIVDGDPDAVDSPQIVQINTPHHTTHEVVVRTSRTEAHRPSAIAIELTDSIDPQRRIEFCNAAARMGIVGATTAVAGVSDTLDFNALVEAHRSLGKSFAGEAFSVLLGVVDYLEDRFNVDGEPIVLLVKGLAVPIGLTLAAIDQRISGLIVDFDGAQLGGAPTGQADLFVDQCVHLGPMPLVTLIQCCAPRPMILVNFPTPAEPWELAGKAGILPPEKQHAAVHETFDLAGHADRLETIAPGRVDQTVIELLPDFLRKHLAMTEND